MSEQTQDITKTNEHIARLRQLFESSIWPSILLATVAVLAAAFAGAILLYDGAWFLFQIADTHRISIPQLRMSFALMQWPAVWVAEASDNLSLTRVVFSLCVMAMPPISIAISWWIVKKDAPWLIVWPALGIFLVDLPGQMHWIATSIRTNQLFWPILMAVFIGMPDRVVPLVAILFISALFMHPQISVFLMAGACAALFLAWQRPEQRQRLLSTAGIFVFGALYRYGLLGSGYETEEASFSNQIAQWQRSVLWLPLIALIAVAIVAIILMLRQYDRWPALRRRNGTIAITVVALIGTVSLVIWAVDASLWKNAIDYRGPSMWHSLILMGLAFLDLAIRPLRQRLQEETQFRILASNVAAVVFCLAIVLQSLSWNGELNKVRSAMATSETGCIAAETLPGFENSPLNFWSLPAASIGLQSTTPNYVVLPARLCQEAVATGKIPIDLTTPNRDTQGRNMNMFHLRSQVINTAICWSSYQAGWHDLETTGSGTRRWSHEDGVVILMMNEAGEVEITGILDTLEVPNEVRIRVNGVVQRNFMFEGDRYSDMTGARLSLKEGPNIVEFLSARPPATPEGDPRELTIAVINLEFRAVSSNEICVWQQLPSQYEELEYKPDGD